MTPEQFSIAIATKHGILAIFGGIVHALSAYRKGETRGVLDIFILAIISSFTGVIFALVALNLYPDNYLTYAIAGVGGFVGVEGLSFVTELIKKRMKRDIM